MGKYYLRPTKIAILGLGMGIKEEERDRECIGIKRGVEQRDRDRDIVVLKSENDNLCEKKNKQYLLDGGSR